MLTVLKLAGFGAYRLRAPARHDGLTDFDGYRRQAAALFWPLPRSDQ
jgi:hypothetical protein